MNPADVSGAEPSSGTPSTDEAAHNGDDPSAHEDAGSGVPPPGDDAEGDDAERGDDEAGSVQEPPLPPPLSFYFSQQHAALAQRRQGCGLPAPAPLPQDLVEHLTTRLEYEAHQGCLSTLAMASCSSTLLQGDALRATPQCLYAEPEVYDALAPVSPCPFDVPTFTYDARRPGFSLHNAYWLLWMATACNLADPELIRAELASRGLEDVRVIQAERLTVAVVERDADVVFVFKGSTETSDYLSNAAYLMKSSDETGLPGRVHSGFYATLASGFAALEPELRAARDLGKTIVFAGHSLGGACAQMAVLKAHSLGVEVAQLYSFSSPRAGDDVFAAALETLLGDRLHRVNNGLDITPHVPPASAAEDAAREAILEILGNAQDPGFVLGSVSVTLQAGLLLADYTHAGGAYAFDRTGYLQARDPSRGDDELAYWQELPGVVGEDDLFDVAAGFGQLPAWHDDATHVCSQARAIDQLLYARD